MKKLGVENDSAGTRCGIPMQRVYRLSDIFFELPNVLTTCSWLVHICMYFEVNVCLAKDCNLYPSPKISTSRKNVEGHTTGKLFQGSYSCFSDRSDRALRDGYKL